MLARYSVASILASLVAGGCACAASALLLDPIDAVFGALLAATTLIIAIVDLDRFEIPDTASVAVFVLGLARTQACGLNVETLIQALARCLITVVLLFALRAGYRAVRKIEGLGFGDVKLAGAGAAWLSPSHIAVAFLLGVTAAIALILGRSLVTGERIRAQAAVPFGTFLAPAIWMVWFVQSAGLAFTADDNQWLSLLGSKPFQ